MKKVSSIVWGVVLIAAGAVFALNALEITDIDVFFDGWWTLILIVPCAVGLFTERQKTGNVIGLLIGVLLLLWRQDVLQLDMIAKLAVPAVIVIIGVKMLFGSFFDSKRDRVAKEMKQNGAKTESGNAMFSGQTLDFSGMVFEGAELNAVFGGIKCDLTNAIIEKDCIINASAIFGGVTIHVPPHIHVKVKSNSIFGGVSDKSRREALENAVTLYIEGTAMFGGVDIK